MRFPRFIAAAALVFAAVLPVYAAAEPGLPAYLPSYSAIAAGVDFNALCDNPQSANLFAGLEKICGQSAGELSKVLLACDRRGKRRMLLAEFDDSKTVDRYCLKVKDRRLSAEDHGGAKVFLLKGQAKERKAVRMVQFSGKEIGLFTAFPAGSEFRIVPGKSPVSRRMPLDRKVLLWGCGTPQIERDYLRHITDFYFILEPDVYGDLLLHGSVKFAGEVQCAAFLIFVKQFLPFALAVKYDVSAVDVYRGIAGLNIRNCGDRLIFSGRDIEPLFRVFTGVFHKQLGKLREIAE